jgi:sulfide dehydrogenase [flavocytochrome c] flavoprotein subunit
MRIDRRRFLMGTAAIPFMLRAEPGRRTPSSRFRAVVVGGGYGGATAARYLRLLNPALDVTLIHRDQRFNSCPGSNEVLADMQPAESLQRGYSNLATRHRIRLITGEVAVVDAAKRKVKLRDGSAVPFDRVIVSPGIGIRWNAWEGYDERASQVVPHAWHGGDDQLERLGRQLRALRPGGVVTLVSPPNPYRCPPGPYERASLIAWYLKRHNPRGKIVILDSKEHFSKQPLFEKGWSDLYPGMIEWIPASREGAIERIDVRRRTVVTEFGEHRADLLNVIPPQQAAALAQAAGLADESGWCPVDVRTFESTRVPSVHVIGDSCSAAPMPKSAFAANAQAKVCAAAIAALAEDRTPGLPSLINHCYSFLDTDYAISVTGVYEYSADEKGLVASSSGETPMDADRRVEARQARAWQQNFRLDVFG